MTTPSIDLNHLRDRAQTVQQRTDAAAVKYARLLAEPLRQIAIEHGDDVVRQTLTRMAIGNVSTWSESLRQAAETGYEKSVRAALAFWAVEADPAAWLALVSGT